MKKLLFITLLCGFFGLSNHAKAQAPNWLWVKRVGGINSDFGVSVSADASGNVFVTGTFASPSITLGTTTLTNADPSGNTDDIFLAKYDALGNVLWAKSAGGTGSDGGSSVTVDASGNIFVTGSYENDSITFGTTTLYNSGTYDIFVAKYDASGNVLWAKSAGGTSDDVGYSVTADASGNVFVTGHFTSSSITFGTTTLANSGNLDIFLAKYDGSGNVLWAKSAGGTNWDESNSVVTDASGNVFVTGFFQSDSITFGTTTLNNPGSPIFRDIFLVKYDASGNVLWAKSAGGIPDDAGYSVAADASGNVFVTGSFRSPSISFDSITLTNAGGNNPDIFVAKYDASGNVLWAKSVGGTGGDRGTSVTVDALGNVFVTGFFYSPSITLSTTTLNNADPSGNTNDIFLAKYDALGNVLWAKSAGGTGGDDGYSIAVDASGNIFVIGYFYSPSISFGTTNLINADPSGNTYDIFLAKLNTVILPACSANFVLYPDTIPHNWIALNQATGTAPMTYTWDWGDSTTSTGATPTHTYSDSGYYNICLTIVDGTPVQILIAIHQPIFIGELQLQQL